MDTRLYDATIQIKGEGYSARTFRVKATTPKHAEIVAMREYRNLIQLVGKAVEVKS